MKYRVLWKNLWKKLTKYMSFAILIPVSFVFIVRFFSNGMSLGKTFEHITLAQLPLLVLGIIAFSAAFSFLISIMFIFATIEISNDEISGPNYWFFRNRIPMNAIKELYPFSNNGIEAIVVNGGKYGKVYISTQTECLSELLGVIDGYTQKKST